MATFKTPGIVLRSRNYRENDRIYTIYTQDFGKIEALALGARKIKSKQAGHLEPGSFSNLMLAHGKNFDKLATADLVHYYRNLFSTFEGMSLATYLLEIVNKLTKTHHKEKRILNLLKETFELLDQLIIKFDYYRLNIILVAKAAVLKFLTILGYQPELYQCLKCRSQIKSSKNYFNLARGGLICSACYQKSSTLPISSKGIQVLRLMVTQDLNQLVPLQLDTSLVKEIKTIIDSFLKYILEENLNSEIFQKKIFKTA